MQIENSILPVPLGGIFSPKFNEIVENIEVLFIYWNLNVIKSVNQIKYVFYLF